MTWFLGSISILLLLLLFRAVFRRANSVCHDPQKLKAELEAIDLDSIILTCGASVVNINVLSVVDVEPRTPVSDIWTASPAGTAGQGSGVIVVRTATLTNYHVVRGATIQFHSPTVACSPLDRLATIDSPIWHCSVGLSWNPWNGATAVPSRSAPSMGRWQPMDYSTALPPALSAAKAVGCIESVY
jgi:hypothetical protein